MEISPVPAPSKPVDTYIALQPGQRLAIYKNGRQLMAGSLMEEPVYDADTDVHIIRLSDGTTTRTIRIDSETRVAIDNRIRA